MRPARLVVIVAACLALSGSGSVFAKWPPSTHKGWHHGKTSNSKTTSTGTRTGFYFMKR